MDQVPKMMVEEVVVPDCPRNAYYQFMSLEVCAISTILSPPKPIPNFPFLGYKQAPVPTASDHVKNAVDRQMRPSVKKQLTLHSHKGTFNHL